MRDRFIPAVIMLVAGMVTSIINILNNVKLYTGLKRLLLVMIIFYIIGLIAKAIIMRASNIKRAPEETVEGEIDKEIQLESEKIQ